MRIEEGLRGGGAGVGGKGGMQGGEGHSYGLEGEREGGHSYGHRQEDQPLSGYQPPPM